MKTLKYKDDTVKELYKVVVNEHPAVNRIVLAYLDNSKKLLITDVSDEIYNSKVVLLKDKEIVNISVSYLGNEIGVMEENKPYIEIYDNVPKREMKPIAIEYHKGERILQKKNIPIYDEDYETAWKYEFIDNERRFDISVHFVRIPFDESVIINGLLDYPEEIKGIRKLLIALSKIIDLKQVCVHLSDYLGSTVSIDKGILNQYIEKKDFENGYATIVLDNDNFYLIEGNRKYHDAETEQMVKKIGGYNGEEERKS